MPTADSDFPRGLSLTGIFASGTALPVQAVVFPAPQSNVQWIVDNASLRIWQAAGALQLFYGLFAIVDSVFGTIAQAYWVMGSPAAAGGFALCEDQVTLTGPFVGSLGGSIAATVTLINGANSVQFGSVAVNAHAQ
jgi:hypothetical protein